MSGREGELGSGLRVEILRGVGQDRAEFERQLLAAGVPLPLPHRCEWARAHPAVDSWFVAVRDSGGAARGGFGIEVGRSRALPGHLLLRVERFGAGPAPEAREAGLAHLVRLARRRGRILRITAEVFAREAEVRATAAGALTGLGFAPVQERHGYYDTLAVDLAPPEDRILASFQELARRNIRKIARFPVELRPVTDPAHAPRIDALLRETFARTGGTHREHDWAARIALSNRAPESSRIVGLFGAGGGPESLLSFAWGCAHGDHAHYEAGGSTRAAESGLPLSYAPMWDLIRWARRGGARWFDLGGVTRGHDGDPNDPLGGISDFKRYFSRDLVRVGEEWVLEPHRLRARVARAVSSGAAWVSRLRRWGRRAEPATA